MTTFGVGHNGGPDDDESQPKLRYVKINITELLEGIEEMNWEQRGYYLTAFFKMYARMGGIPYDDYEGAKVMRCDIRTFRRLRDYVLKTGKFFVEDGLLKNRRVINEINAYIAEFKKRSEAGQIREARARLDRQKQPELPLPQDQSKPGVLGKVGAKSGKSRGKVSEKSGELPANFAETSGRLGGENLIISKDAPPRLSEHSDHKLTSLGPLTTNHEPETSIKRREDLCAIDIAPSATPEELFEVFWKAFPGERRRGKGEARSKFLKIATGKHGKLRASAQTMIQAVKESRGIDPEMPPLPETWLNQGRWEDDPCGQHVGDEEPKHEVNGKRWGWWRGKEEGLRALEIERWTAALAKAKPNGTWPWWILTAPPGHPECLMPAELQEPLVAIYRGKIHHVGEH